MAVLIYLVSWVITYMIFGNAIHNLLVPIQLKGGG
jgi:hypothetical protein